MTSWPATTSPPPSGEQFEITHGDQRATVVEVGGGIRMYEVGTRQVLDPYASDAMCDGAHGTPLIPWPNRLAGGRYSFAGVDHQLPLTDPERLGAIHGLLRWTPWRAIERGSARVVMGTRLYPQPGYPFMLDVTITYELSDIGLLVHTSATNLGEQTCPFGCGQHPYLAPGGETVDECMLEFGARTRILADERGVPVGREPVSLGGPMDFSEPRRIGELVIDDGFTELPRDETGRATVALTGVDGARVELWMDESYNFLQLFTGDTLAPGRRRRRGLAAEPMTCPANAFATGESVLTLEPGESFVGEWGVALS